MACKQYDAGADASNAHQSAANVYLMYATAVGEAESATKSDARWTPLSTALDQIKADIGMLAQVASQYPSPAARSPAASATINEQLGLLTGHLAAVDLLCRPLTGASHPVTISPSP